MNPGRLLRMSPAEIATRAQQAFSKRYAKPPACRLIEPKWAATLPGSLPGPASRAAVEKLLQHRFDLLGYQDLNFGNPIDWHYDPVHQKRSPRKPWSQIPFLDFNQVGDHKIIWELNRHQYLVTLAQAGCRDEVVAQWSHWQTENAYPIGINWASALEAAFRALSWLWVRHYLGDFHPGLTSALHLHGWYIDRFLSTYFSPNTHLLGEAVALFAIGLLCPQISEAEHWKSRGWNILLEQAETQVRADGFHFEQSVYYHVYARDFFQFARDLAAHNGLPIPAQFERTLEKMNEAVAILSQAGRLPNFGDDDGGALLVPRPQPIAPPPSRPTGGIYSMGDRQSQLFIRAAEPAPFTAGHTHADALSIQLVSAGRPVLIDSGTYCYVCPDRDRFRGTAAHNTLEVNGRDQATPAGPFAWTDVPQTIVSRWHSDEVLDFFEGHHNGYSPMIHHRYVVGLKNRFWLVRDVCSAAVSSPAALAIRWHYLDDSNLAIIPPANHSWTQSVESTDWSPIYGKKEPAKVLRFQTQSQLPAEFAVILQLGSFGHLTQIGPGAYRYKEPQGSHEFIFAAGRLTYRLSTPAGVTEHSI